jgi:hypothetical protein
LRLVRDGQIAFPFTGYWVDVDRILLAGAYGLLTITCDQFERPQLDHSPHEERPPARILNGAKL